MKEDLVSIIMPSYNTGKFIKETINSVLNQTYNNWELIIVDDCSTDDTEEIVNAIKDNRIKFLKNSTNSGAAISRNKAIKEAKGKWIAFLDSDDLWKKEKLEKQIRFMEENHYDFSYTNYTEIDEEGNEKGIKITGPKKITKTGIYNYCWPGCLTVMYNAEKIGLIQIEDIKENQNPLISKYQINKTYIQQFFEAMKQNLGSETTYDPGYVGGWSRSFTLFCENGNVFEYHGNYCIDSNEDSLTTNIVEELLTKCQIVI